MPIILSGRRATDTPEPCQIRKEAAIREAICVVVRSRLVRHDQVYFFEKIQVTNLPTLDIDLICIIFSLQIVSTDLIYLSFEI